MTVPLAQMMEGMQWIPVMLVVTIGGVGCGFVGLLVRIFSSAERSGRCLGKWAVGFGVGSVVLFFFLEGSNLSVAGYLILATPILLGVIVLIIPPSRKVRFVLKIFLGLIAIGSVGDWFWALWSNAVPRGVTVESPTEYGWETPSAVRNPFGSAPSIDAEGKLFSDVFKSSPTSSTSVSVNLPFLDEFSGSNRQLLLRHLATSAKWSVGREMFNGQEKIIARRRYVESGMWLNQLNGFYNDVGENPTQFRIVLGLDGTGYAQAFPGSTFARSNQGVAQLNVAPDHAGSPRNDSYLVVTSSGACLEVFEESTRKDRPFTPVALSQLSREFDAVLTSAMASQHGFDPSLMPRESIRRGRPDLHLISYGEEEGVYQVIAYVNPGESGYVYLKAFEGGGNSRIMGDDYSKRESIEYIGWSSDPREQFFYNTEDDFDQPLLGNSYCARIEMWFVPSSGAPERKLFEKYFEVK